MSNFETLSPVSSGLPGSAVQIFTASTVNSFGTITATGYLNDLGDKVKANDIFHINYSDLSTFNPNLIISATYGLFQASLSGANMSLVPLTVSNGAGGAMFFDVTVGQAALASAGHVALIQSTLSQQYKLRGLWANLVGTDFSGNSGDRNLSITDGTTVYSIIPATNLQTLVNSGWGISTPLPFPASASINTSTVAGSNLYAAYSGGTADYSAGSIVLTGMYQRVA